MIAGSGMRSAFRLVTQSAHNGPKRAIHIPTGRPLLPTSGGSARNVLNQVRSVVNRLLYGISNAGSHAHTFTRGIHLSQPIRSQLSLPARHLTSRPLGAPGSPFLPRAPGVQRGITQVGLGTARNFSSARPIFQSIAKNVPVTGRALYEADLDVEKKKARRLDARKVQKDGNAKKSKEMSKPRPDPAAFERYFEELPPSEVTTILTVPLHPASTESSVPVRLQNPGSLIPARAVSETHSAHTTHALRITSLFLRLDQAHVWQNGAHYEAFGMQDAPFDPGTALCTSLRIVFDGWTEEQVKAVIGEAGRGWCTMREERRTINAPMSVESSRAVTPVSAFSVFDINMDDPAYEFEMPTLDFSSTFLESRAPTPFRDMSTSPLESPVLDCISLPSTRGTSVSGDEFEWHWSDTGSPPPVESNLDRRELAFSAEFMTRGQDMMSNF